MVLQKPVSGPKAHWKQIYVINLNEITQNAIMRAIIWIWELMMRSPKKIRLLLSLIKDMRKGETKELCHCDIISQIANRNVPCV